MSDNCSQVATSSPTADMEPHGARWQLPYLKRVHARCAQGGVRGNPGWLGNLFLMKLCQFAQSSLCFLGGSSTFVATIPWEKEPTGCTSYLESTSLPWYTPQFAQKNSTGREYIYGRYIMASTAEVLKVLPKWPGSLVNETPLDRTHSGQAQQNNTTQQQSKPNQLTWWGSLSSMYGCQQAH